MTTQSPEAVGLSSDELAREVAIDLPAGVFVNLGIGIPQKVAKFLVPGREVVFHGENGILGMGPPASEGEEDFDLIDAGKVPITLALGGSYVSHADSFAIIRGGHLDVCILGGYQVSSEGDLANWNDGEDIPAVGGAMDLALGARTRIVMMKHNDKKGRAKLVQACTLPITAQRCVHRVYTELGIFEPVGGKLRVLAMTNGISEATLAQRTDIALTFDNNYLRLPRGVDDVLPYSATSTRSS